jgi:hypothetical protein
MLTITTKFLKPTNTQGSRVKATCAGKTITRPYDYTYNGQHNHARVAMELAEMVDLRGTWVCGDVPFGYIFVQAAAPKYHS